MDDFERDGRPSKSAAKRAHQALQTDVEKLSKLADEKLVQLDLPERLLDQLRVTRGMKSSSARNRQLRFVTGIYAKLDEEDRSRVSEFLSRR